MTPDDVWNNLFSPQMGGRDPVDTFYAPYHQVVSPIVTPVNPVGVGSVDGVPAGGQPAAQPDRQAALKLILDFVNKLHETHVGTGGEVITPDNPTGNASNPWGAGGAFEPISPAIRHASQGGNAINQWTALLRHKHPQNAIDWADLFASAEH